MASESSTATAQPVSGEEQIVWESPDKRFTKTVLSKGFGFYCPQDGSVCKLKVIADEAKVLIDVNDEGVKELIIGDVDEPLDRILEACVRTMKMEEVCKLKFFDPTQPLPPNKTNGVQGEVNETGDGKDGEKSSTNEILGEENCTTSNNVAEVDESEKMSVDNPDQNCTKERENEGIGTEATVVDSTASEQNCVNVSENNVESESNDSVEHEKTNLEDMSKRETFDCSPTIYEVQLQLLIYTREPEIWEMSITEKWRRANYHKQKGMDLYSRGLFEWAFRRFGLSLKYIISLEHDLPTGQDEEGMNISALKLSCYLNIAACQMRHHNYESVAKNCTKALEMQPNNSKALYRRGAANIQLQEYETAKADLDKAFELEPKNPAIISQQQLLKAKVQVLNQYYANAMKKMFM